MYNPNRSIYPAMMRRHSHSPSPFYSSVESGSPLPPSPPDSSWEYQCSTSSVSSPSRSSSSCSPLCSSPPPSSPPPQTPLLPSLSPSGIAHHREKPGGKRKYKSRHLDSNDKDPTWRLSGSHRKEKRRGREEKERKRRRGRADGGRRKERHQRERESGGYCGESSSRRSREERSPSVEIIYEGTITSDATRPPARKRRRKRPRRTQANSSPVIITLDSDSSHDDANNKNISSSSSPISSQQTVDFSDLPPLPLAPSASVGGALDGEIGELPADILDRGSDGSEAEPVGRSGTAGPIAVDNSDNSDRDVDVENVEESNLRLVWNDDKGRSSSNHGPIRKVATQTADGEPGEAVRVDGGPQPTGGDGSLPHQGNATCDSRLQGTFLHDLRDTAIAKSVPQPKRLQAPLKPGDRSLETGCPGERRSNQGGDCHTSTPPLASLREEAMDVPPLLKKASPVQAYNRNTPPPLKHKDAGCPRLSPAPPGGLLSPVASVDPAGAGSDPPISHAERRLPPELAQATAPVPTLTQVFTGAPASSSLASCPSGPIDCHPVTSSQVTALTTDTHSTSPRPALDLHLPPRADGFPHLDFLPCSKLHSRHDGSSAIPFHAVNSFSVVDFHSAPTGWSKEPARTDSTSDRCRPDTLSTSCELVPVDLHLSSSGGPASGVSSGVHAKNTSPAVLVSRHDSRTEDPSSDKRENLSQRTGLNSGPSTPKPRGRLSPVDSCPRNLKPPTEFHSSSAASEGLTDGEASVHHEDPRPPDGLTPPIDFPRSSPLPPVTLHVSARMDGHLNHAALPSSAVPVPRRHRAGPTVEAPPEHHDLCDPIESHCESDARSQSSQRDLHTRLMSFSHSAQNRWDATDARSDSPSAVDKSVWTTHTHSAT